MNNVEVIIKESSSDFINHVFPMIKHWDWLKDTKIIPVETKIESELARKFDVLAGIDYLQIVSNRGIRGLASRVQWGMVNAKYKSFTIRKTTNNNTSNNTELKKRMDAIFNDSGLIYPYYVIQSYLLKKGLGPLLFSCMMKTIDLFGLYKNYPNLFLTNNAPDGNEFLYIRAHKIKKDFPLKVEMYDKSIEQWELF